ncbi:MAG: PilN domain-containing protein [Patescibacteria group bacterium]
METGIKSSFIPQSPITPSRVEARHSPGGMNFFVLASLVVFVASATLAAGVFLYAQYLSASVASKLEQLERAKQAFEPSLIQDLTRLDDRMRAADVILGTHVAPTALFHLLEQLTLQTVAFSTLDFSSGNDGIEVTMQGVAQSVNSIALQADLLAKSGVISNPIFSNINRQPGGVRFDFTAKVEPQSLSYGQVQQPGTAPAVEPIPAAPASPFGTPGEEQHETQQ